MFRKGGRLAEQGEKLNKSVAKTADSGIIKKKSTPLKINIQLFAESDIKKQSSTSLQRGIRNFEKRINEHNEKICNPEKYISDWNGYSENHKSGLLKHWKKEINNFQQSIKDRKEELIKRGDNQ